MTIDTSEAAVKTYDIGPGAIASPSTDDGPAFSLSSANWIAIQTYVIDGLALPATNDAFKTYLGAGAPADLSDFQELIDCYAKINAACKTWQDQTYPASVSLASDIYDYGTSKAPTYFPPINVLATKLSDNADDATSLKQLKALLDNLIADASGRATKATAVKAQIKQFADDTQASKNTLSGPPSSPGGLVKKYNDEYGAKSEEVISINKEISDMRDTIKTLNDEYNHDVVVAATSPTYAWIWPVGTIAAAVVAGVYGKKATDALDTINADRQQIETWEATLQSDAMVLMALNSAESGMGAILNALNAALPIIELVEGVWGGIADDLTAIAQKIDTDIQQALPILMSLGVESAVKAWHNVALSANAYRVNAYVTQTS